MVSINDLDRWSQPTISTDDASGDLDKLGWFGLALAVALALLGLGGGVGG